MSIENAVTSDSLNHPPMQEASENEEMVKSKRPRSSKKKETDDLRLPLLVELTFTISVLFIILVSLSVLITSIVSGANLLHLVLRTGVTLLVLGSLVTLISSQISSGMLAASRAEKETFESSLAEVAESSTNTEETVQVEA